MTRFALSVLAATALIGGTAVGGETKGSLATLVAAERAFAKMASDTTVRDAFVANFAEESTVMRPGPVDAQTWFASHPKWGVAELITWDPSVAGISAAGDVGYTSGPWQFRTSHDLSAKPVAYGFFCTVWVATPEGWKVRFDHGVGTPEPAAPIAPFDASTAPASPAAAKADVAAATASLEKAEAALVADPAKAYAAALADDALLLRGDRAPATGRAAAAALAAAAPAGDVTYTRAGQGVSRSADLAYVFGTVAFATPKDKAVPGAYLRVWRRGADGAWRLALDLLDPPAVAQ